MSGFSILGFGVGSLLLNVASASTFQPNCTLPPELTNFVSAPNVRGTTTIMWSSLSIILLCTWNIQRLNVPAGQPYYDDKGKAYGKIQKTWWAVLDSRTKLKWMFLTVIMPEYIMGKALNQWLSARLAYKTLQEWEKIGGKHKRYEMIHAYVANMGGFYLDFTGKLPTDDGGKYFERLVKDIHDSPNENTRTRIDHINLSRLKYNRWVLTFGQLKLAKHFGLFDSLPDVSAQDLERSSSSDTLVKILAILQVSWLMLQLLARKINSLPSSQLEIAALAFSASSFVTYIVLWSHPPEMLLRYKIEASKLPHMEEVRGVMWNGPQFQWTLRGGEPRRDGDLGLVPIPNDASHDIAVPQNGRGRTLQDWLYYNNSETLSVLSGSIFGGVLFGGIHCLAWNFHFPTSVEQLLWRISAILTTALPLLSIPSNIMWAACNAAGTPGHRHGQRGLVYAGPKLRLFCGLSLLVLFLIPYVVARLFIMVEAFRSLFYLPSEAFIATWSGNYPHGG